MKNGFFRHLTLSVSLAVLTAGLAQSAAAQDSGALLAAPGVVSTQDTGRDSPSVVVFPLNDGSAPARSGAPQLTRPAASAAVAQENSVDSHYAPGAATPMPAAPVAAVSQPLPRHGWATMTLKQSVGIGVNTNPEHGVVANNRRATDEELRQAKGLYLPSIDTRFDTGYEHTRNAITEAGIGSDSENMWRANAGITLTQMLFDGFAAKYENLRQQARVLSAAHRVREAAELNGLAVVEDYLEVMRQRELLKIARENVAQHTGILDQIRDATESGKTTQADHQQAAARLAASRAEEENVRQALRNAEADYIRDVGQQPEDLVMPLLPAGSLERDVEQEVRESLSGSPTVKIYEADMKVAHQEYEATQAPFYPRLDLQLQAQDGHNVNALEGQSRNASALVVANWNLYRGGIDTAKRREYISREAQAKEQRAKVARSIEDDVRKSWAGMVAARERKEEFVAQAANNEAVVKAYKDQFDLNRRTLLDVLDSQNELFVSRANAINAQYLEMFAVYRLLALKGDLLKTLDVSVPREADPAKM
jgi:outer membrane protein, adhesin transport system